MEPSSPNVDRTSQRTDTITQKAIERITKNAVEELAQNEVSKHGFGDSQTISPEQETLSTIARDLDLLCQAPDENKSMRLYTGPYGRIISPFKKFSSFQAFSGGGKRSPRKLSGPAPKRTKLFHGSDHNDSTSNSDESPTLPKVSRDKVKQVLQKMDEAEASGEDSSEEDKWEIVEEDEDTELDDKLQDQSTKFSLSAMNVKSIIHKIVTNENVVEMVRKAVREEIEEQGSKFEPKMTRSKLKEFEAKGTLPVNWGLSPRKKRESPNFLEMELPDDEEDDEDFNPDKIVLESDEDSESVHSACHLSDVGSPMPSSSTGYPTTPTTISCASSSQGAWTTPTHTDNENSSQSFLSPMGPPLQTNVPKSHHKSTNLGQRFRDAMEQEEEELIARRTRSKYPLNECSILDLEANFVAPDITPDMYDTSCDDYDWREFLAGICTPVEDKKYNNPIDIDDPENDPEYDFLGDANNIEIDQEDFRDDRAVKVSKKEVNELLDDILNCENETNSIDEQYKITIKTQSEKIVFDSNKKKQKVYQQALISEIGEYERRQIDDQIRKHVQQLAQTYVMTCNGIEEHQVHGETAKSLLMELDSFGKKATSECGESAFDAVNLAPALTLVNDDSWNKEPEPTDEENNKLEALTFKYDVHTLPAFSYQQMHVMWNSTVFMFPELLPHGGFYKVADLKKDRSRVKFLESEDNLLAMGISQFQHLKKEVKDYIQRFMLPCKTRKQIEIRIKNLKATAAKDNPVKFFYTHGMLPKFPQHAPLFDDSTVKAPIDCACDWHELPLWCKFFCVEAESGLNESLKDQQQRRMVVKKRRKAKQTASFSLSEAEISTMRASPFLTLSAPATPKTDSSMFDSSESSPEMSPVKRKRRVSRRKLNMSKVTDAGNSLLSSFVPLSMSTSNSTQSAPLTICVINSTNVGTATVQTIEHSVMPVSVSQTTIPVSGIPVVSTIPVVSETPTVVVIDENGAINTTATLGLPHHNQSIDPGANSLSQNLNIQSADFESDAGDDIDNLTFEDICQSIKESELGTCSPVKSVNTKFISKTTDNKVKISVQPFTEPVSAASHDLQSNSSSTIIKGVHSKVVLDQNVTESSLDKETSSVSDTNVTISVSTVSVVNSDSNSSLVNVTQCVSATSQNDVMNSDSKTSVHSSHSCETTPNSKLSYSDSSSGEKTPTSALDVVASLASYFLSPGQNSEHLTQQQRLEMTPTKNRYIPIAPKASPVNETGTKTLTFRRSPRVKKASPRKRQLQQQVQTILPKGFVVSTYDTSPAKKAASVLVDKAKQVAMNQSPSLRKLLPRPPNSIKSPETLRSSNKTSKSRTRTKTPRKSGIMVENKDKGVVTPDKNNLVDDVVDDSAVIEDIADDISEPVNSVASAADDDDRYTGDTESDYTQSEDGNETQGTDGEDMDTQGTDDGDITPHGTDGDSQDSQEEDESTITDINKHTQIRYPPSKDYLLSRARHVKKDRNRDMTLSLLEPDIVESDPQRDLRDTLFAQAYIHKVKKALKDNMEKLEAFLKIMCNFSKEGESPIKLYGELKDLFSDHTDLMYDFAGFLEREQAIQCGCYKAYQEFHQARAFLRKLELYFSKNPNQLQKVMRTFSRWYKKPGRHDTDLREQIEPMLKGQKILVEEFASFFPNSQPSESLMDDFEEVNLDDSGDNCTIDKESSFEEIELLDLEEVYGTKRCTCKCHDSGDDTYRKRKKHCYNCGLTVIDGELVYKVNKTTIKKINVKFGPSIKLNPQKDFEESEETGAPVQNEILEPVQIVNSEPFQVVDHNSNQDSNLEQVTIIVSDTQPSETNQLVLANEDSAETVIVKHVKKEIPFEENSPDTITVNDAPANVPAMVIVDKPQEQTAKTIKENGTNVDNSDKDSTHVEVMEVNSVHENVESLITTENESVTINENNSVKVTEANSERKIESCIAQLEEVEETTPEEMVSVEIHIVNDVPEGVDRTNTNDGILEQNNDLDVNTENTVLSEDKKANDILATAFTSALSTEVSMDSLMFPFSTKHPSPEKNTCLNTNDSCKISNISDPKISFASSAKTLNVDNLSRTSAPVGLSTLNVSCDSSFSKVTSVQFTSKDDEKQSQPKQNEAETKIEISKKKVEKLTPLSSLPDTVSVSDGSRSPQFSPFSPFAQEIQSITCGQSSFSAVNSPGICRSLSTSSKVRRITPIPVKDNEASTDSPLAFQNAVENSPVLPELQSVCSPADKVISGHDSQGSCSVVPITSANPDMQAFTKTDSNSTSQKCESLSQKSSGSSNSNSVNIELSSSQTPVKMDGCYNSITISKPDFYSQNANVGFPKSVSKTGITPSGILSEESLFQCLSKPPQFTDTLHTVSGLTNILNALDEHSVAHNQTMEVVETKTNVNEKNDDSFNKNVNNSNVHAINTSENQAVTNTNSEASHVEKISKMDKDENTSGHNFLHADKFNENPELSTRNTESGNEINKVNDSDKNTSNTDNSKQVEEISGSRAKHKKSKMSRRELRRSLQGKDLEEEVNCVDDTIDDIDDFKPEYSDTSAAVARTGSDSVIKDESQMANGINTDRTKNCDVNDSSAVDSAVNARTAIDQSEVSECDNVNINVKTEPSIDDLEYSGTSDAMSVSETLTETSSSKHVKKVKHKNRSDKERDRKKKKRKEESSSDKKDRKHKKKSKKAEQRKTTAEPFEVETMNTTSPVNMKPRVDATGSPRSMLLEEGEVEPEWSKETDKTILETCKIHGIKDKTFSRIAKRIGNVTAKQVRKRFSMLYQMIFGVPVNNAT